MAQTRPDPAVAKYEELLQVLLIEPIAMNMGEVIIVGGAAIHKRIPSRPIGDLDLVIMPRLWKILVAEGYTVAANYMGGFSSVLELSEDVHAFDMVDVPDNRGGGGTGRHTMTAAALRYRAEFIDGLFYQNLDDVLDMKRGMSRDKDKADVMLLEAWMKKGHR